MCLYPKLITNPKYKGNKKNNYNPPECKDGRVIQVPIGCGKCIECRRKKQREWVVRLNEEIRTQKEAKFVTLTFSNENYTKLYSEVKLKYKETEGYDIDNQIATLAVRRMLERYRKKNKKSVRHWLVTELGGNGTENIHIHGIVFKNITKEELEKYWQYGYVDNGQYVNEATVAYITKYITKIDKIHTEYKSIILTSAGIGNNYINRIDSENNKYKESGTNENYRLKNGTKMAMPIYFRNKIYTEEEREKLWLEKLDKQERWVMGEKIDISKGEEEYYKILKYYQAKNKQMGYGDDKMNWNEKKYQEERRKLKQEERLKESKGS